MRNTRVKNTKFLYTQQNRKYKLGGNVGVLCTVRCSLCWTLEISDSVDINSIFQGVILKTATFSSNANDSGIDKAPAGPTAIIKSFGGGDLSTSYLSYCLRKTC
jgi:hypothetical protein